MMRVILMPYTVDFWNDEDLDCNVVYEVQQYNSDSRTFTIMHPKTKIEYDISKLRIAKVVDE